jgi:hypothetical protein
MCIVLVGDLSEWHQQFRSVEERLVEAVEAAWPLCITPLQSLKGAMTHEDHITNQLVNALIRTKKVPGRIVAQYPLLTENQQQLVKLSSFIDFVLTIGDAENVYLACECKRLNVPYKKRTRGLAHEYVRDGLMRFVTGQYSHGLPLAMMLGYVMNANGGLAHQRVNRALSRSKTINLKTTTDRPAAIGKSIRFSTTHDCTSGHYIQVNHTLLCWP